MRIVLLPHKHRFRGRWRHFYQECDGLLRKLSKAAAKDSLKPTVTELAQSVEYLLWRGNSLEQGVD